MSAVDYTMQESDSILLKIKRQFSKEESHAYLLKYISDLKFELGEIKSELAEVKYENHQLKNSLTTDGKKLKKEWLKEDMVAQIQLGLKTSQRKNILLQKQLNDVRDRYYSLLLSKKNNQP